MLPFCPFYFGAPLLKTEQPEKGYPYYKEATQEPRAEESSRNASLGGCSDASVVEELLGELDWQGLTPNLEAFLGV